MESHILNWLNLTIRWIHVIVGIAWIGASFYFVWLENNLERGKKDLPDEIAGDLWAIHGGGFYYLRKFKVAPAQLPPHLHWFKWEAYATWLSGVALLTVVYYLNAETFMVDPAVAEISGMQAIGIGVASLVAGWAFYDILCRTPILKKPVLMLILMFGFLTASAYVLEQFLSARAAYIHVGAMIGTMMAGNVLFVIIPGQRKLVEAAEAGREPDPWDGIYGGLRSRHNNYFTLPVLFIMISNHFPVTYNFEHGGWLMLAAISALGVAVRHHFNVRHESSKWAWTMPAAAIGIALLAWFTVPSTSAKGNFTQVKEYRDVEFNEVKAIVATRCLSCHSANNTDDVFIVAPNGMRLDEDELIVKWAGSIKNRVYDLQNMPMNNKTEITNEERLILAAWVHQGASID